MKGNFDLCLREVLRHEGGYVDHPCLAMIDKLFYVREWSTQQNSPGKFISPFRLKVLSFIKRWLLKIPEHIPVTLRGASTMPMPGDCAMHITSGSVMAKTCLPPSGTETEEVNAENVIAPLMEKADGHFAKAITPKEGALSCAQFVLRLLADAALNVVNYIRIMFMIFITLVTKEKTSRLVMPLKALALKSLRQKYQSAFFYAQTATG